MAGKMKQKKGAAEQTIAGKSRESFSVRLGKNIRKNWILYVMILPVLVYYIVFAYAPMYGVQLAFKNYRVKDGIFGSPWVGFDHFKRFFSAYNFRQLLMNTLEISVYSILVGFPIPIIFALMLNYVKNKHLKKAVQMVSYAPYFISTVVMCGMITIFMSTDSGIFNIIRGFLGMEPVDALSKPGWFKSIYVWSGVWQGMGWSSIIYISALSGVDMQLHEAAIVDGATKLQRILHVDLPSIKPTIIMLLILQMGSLMGVGFEKVFLLQNTLNKSTASVISTYVYEVGLINSDYGYSTAVGLFNSVINVVLIVTANQLSKRLADESLF
nr:ABC transporter permease subunit [uncultured Acetatifactor sp.]